MCGDGQRGRKAQEEGRPAGEKCRHRAVGLAQVDILAARARQGGRQFGHAQRPAHRHHAAEHPQPEDRPVVAQRRHHVAGRNQDARPDHAGHHHEGRGRQAEPAGQLLLGAFHQDASPGSRSINRSISSVVLYTCGLTRSRPSRTGDDDAVLVLQVLLDLSWSWLSEMNATMPLASPGAARGDHAIALRLHAFDQPVGQHEQCAETASMPTSRNISIDAPRPQMPARL